MKISIKKNIESSMLFYILLALACMNFLGRGSLICLVFAMFALLKTKSVMKIDGGFLLALLLSMSVATAALVFYDLTEVVKAWNYVLLYYVGYNGFVAAEDKTEFVKRTVFAIFAGFGLNVVVTYLYNRNISTGGRRIIYNFWTNELMSVTLVGLLSSVIIGYSFYAIFVHKKLWMKLTGIASVWVMFLFNIQTATRTPIILFIIVYSFMLLVWFISGGWRKRFKWLVLAAVIIVLLATVYAYDVAGIKTYIVDSPLFERFASEGIETARNEIAVYYFEHMFDSIWGGGKVGASYESMAHNFIQEGHDKYGIFATVAMIGLLAGFVKNLCKLLFNPKSDIDFLFVSMYLALIIQICLEPVFDGYPVVVMILLMIHGMVSAYMTGRDNLMESCAQ